MTKSKLYLRNSARAARLFSILCLLFLSGCQNKIEPSHKEDDIPYQVKKICKEEYGVDVVTQRTPTTLWIYAPLNKILHKDFGIKEGKIFDEEISEKLRYILTTLGRVVMNSDNTSEFFALFASDIKVGLDYIIIGNVSDIKKTYAGFIPWSEANRRYLMKFRRAPAALGDLTGQHMQAYDITLSGFLAELIAQRIFAQFNDEDIKKYFKVTSCNGRFAEDKFIFEYSIEETSQPKKEINIREIILNMIAYCIQAYEFKDFNTLEINDLLKQERIVLSRPEILSRPLGWKSLRG